MAKMLPKSNVTDVKFEGAGSGSGSGKKISTLMELRLGAAQADYVMGKALVAKGAGPGSAGDLKKCRKYAVRPMSFAMRSLWAARPERVPKEKVPHFPPAAAERRAQQDIEWK